MKAIFTKASKKKKRIGKDTMSKLEGRSVRELAGELQEVSKQYKDAIKSGKILDPVVGFYCPVCGKPKGKGMVKTSKRVQVYYYKGRKNEAYCKKCGTRFKSE